MEHNPGMDPADYERWWRERGSEELRGLLYREWDPIGVKDLADGPDDEYDAYVGQLGRRLRAGADEDEVATLLQSFRIEMGLEPGEPPLETARLIGEWYRGSSPSAP
jgi:hypothetical protein